MEEFRSNRVTNVVLPHPVGPATMHVKGCFQRGSMWVNERSSGCRFLLHFQRRRAETVGEYFALPVEALTRNTQTVIGHTNLCNKYGGPWTLAILALPDNLTFDLTHLIRMHIDGKI